MRLEQRHLAQYGYGGYGPLKLVLAEYLRVTRMMSCSPQQILILNGSHQALDLCARMLADIGDVAINTFNLQDAVRIIEEGLKAGLNPAQGGQLALNLKGLYDYSIQRLTLANLRNDGAAIDEVVALIEPLADSWKVIRAQAVQGA